MAVSGKPKISVCVSAYNQQAYIQSSLISVLAQIGDFDLEILVGNDCSTDGTREVIDAVACSHPGRLKTFHRTNNLGFSGNFHALVAEAEGDYIAHLDGDDLWLPGKIAAQLAFLQANEDCIAVYSNAAVITDDGAMWGAFNNPQPATFDICYLMREGNFLLHSSVLYRRSACPSVLDLPASRRPMDFTDYRLHLELASHGKLGYLNAAYAVYRLGSATSVIKYQFEMYREQYWELIAAVASMRVPRADVCQAIANFLAPILGKSLRRGQFAYGRKWMRKLRQELPEFARGALLLSCLLLLRNRLLKTQAQVAASIKPNDLHILHRR